MISRFLCLSKLVIVFADALRSYELLIRPPVKIFCHKQKFRNSANKKSLFRGSQWEAKTDHPCPVPTDQWTPPSTHPYVLCPSRAYLTNARVWPVVSHVLSTPLASADHPTHFSWFSCPYLLASVPHPISTPVSPYSLSGSDPATLFRCKWPQAATGWVLYTNCNN